MMEYRIERSQGNAGHEETLSTEIVEAENIEQALRESMHGEDWPIRVRDEDYASACDPESDHPGSRHENCYIAERLVSEDCACPECGMRDVSHLLMKDGDPVSCKCCGWRDGVRNDP